MRILHYSLGFPPYRSGGLTKLCVDLMIQQSKEGHNLSMLWPGKMGFLLKKTSIRKNASIILKGQCLCSYEIINPLPVPFDEGITDFNAFCNDVDERVYLELLDELKPDIIHVHTLMGLHKSFLLAAKKNGVKLVFTAHDFFPICPKVIMFCDGISCKHVNDFSKCGECNITALGINTIKILQSPIYRKLKDSIFVKKMRKNHRDKYLNEVKNKKTVCLEEKSERYRALRDYYYSLLKLMDIIHYNSTMTKSVYDSVFDLNKSCVINITHSDIVDKRLPKVYDDKKIRIRYLGPQGEAKGYYIIKKALDELWKSKHNFCLDVHFKPLESSPYENIHESYSHHELKDIFDNTDILIAPSILYETFGFTVLEALSYGVPVIISDTVGAKDILVDGAGIIVEDISCDKLYDIINNLTSEKLIAMNKTILEHQHIMMMKEFSELINKKCYEV